MSMSEMSKARYKALRLSVRTNGLTYTVRTMCNCLEAADIRELFSPRLNLLAMRANWYRSPNGDDSRTIFLCTRDTVKRFKAPLP